MNQRLLGRAGTLVAALTIALASAPAVLADGEIGDIGDRDSITDVFVSNSHATARVDYVKDCPTGLSCSIEVNFQYRCPEAWCTGWTSQGWKPLPAPTNGVSTVQAYCNPAGDNDNYWRVQYRLKWWASTNKTVELWGETEVVNEISGGIVYRLIAEAAYNQTNSAGLRAGTKIETDTGTAEYGPAVVVATSGPNNVITC